MNKPPFSVAGVYAVFGLLLSFLVTCSSTRDPTRMAVAEAELEDFIAQKMCEGDDFRLSPPTVTFTLAARVENTGIDWDGSDPNIGTFVVICEHKHVVGRPPVLARPNASKTHWRRRCCDDSRES